MVQLQIDSVTFTAGPQDGGITHCFKRYRSRRAADPHHSVNPLVLVLGHCVGAHKESWEPTISHLFEMQRPSDTFYITEFWSMDSPNHGEAGAINEAYFLQKPEGIPAAVWGRGFLQLLESDYLKCSKVVVVGHSASVAVLLCATLGYSIHKLPFASMIMVEPGMVSREMLANAAEDMKEIMSTVKAARRKRDTWASREEAQRYLRPRFPFKDWDERVFQAFLQYGLRDLPSATYPEIKSGVTLSCTRIQETAGYVHFEDSFASLDRLRELCPAIPISCIFGSELSTMSAKARQSTVEASEAGGGMQPIMVQGAGHMIVQEVPERLAHVIRGILGQPHTSIAQSKL